jgi:hypothetical protein
MQVERDDCTTVPQGRLRNVDLIAKDREVTHLGRAAHVCVHRGLSKQWLNLTVCLSQELQVVPDRRACEGVEPSE